MAEKRKRTTARSATKKAPARKKTAPKAGAKRKAPAKRVSPEERFRLIQEAAYYRAEKAGFNCDQSECWLAAEAEVDARLAGAR